MSINYSSIYMFPSLVITRPVPLLCEIYKILRGPDFFLHRFAGGGVPGHAGEQWSSGLRSGGAERDGSVLLRTDCKAAAHQVEAGWHLQPQQ